MIFGHDCSHYEPEDAEKGDEYVCCCGVRFVLVRTFPWRKWVSKGRDK